MGTPMVGSSSLKIQKFLIFDFHMEVAGSLTNISKIP